MNVHRRISGLLLAATLGGGFACGAAKTTTSTEALPATGQGQLALELVDAPSPVADEIWVNLTEVKAHSAGGGWVSVKSFRELPDGYLKFDLLKLQTSTQALGFVNLPAGTTITQIRLLVTLEGNEVVVGDAHHPLKVPSGYQSGIKIQGPWTIEECSQTKLTIDFDGHKSIWYHPTGSGDDWILRPVIHVKKEAHATVGCDVPPPAHVPDVCTGNVACPGTEICTEGNCKGGTGTTCADPVECVTNACDVTGHCGQGGTDAGCYGDTDCASNKCVDNVCQPSDPGGACVVGSPESCAGGTCNPDGSCSPPTEGVPGTSCSATQPCAYGVCNNGTCGSGGVNTPCTPETVSTDCDPGLACIQGFCAVKPMG